MRAAQIVNLDGTFGRLRAAEPRIWNIVADRQIERVGLDVRQATRADRDELVKHGARPMIVVDRGNFPDRDGVGLADVACDWLDDHGFTGADARAACDIVLVNERHGDQDACNDILSMIRHVRGARGRYLRTLIWGMEGLQAGWFTDELVHVINTDVDLTVVAEAYHGPSATTRDMDPISADAVKMNLIRRGVRDERAKVYYGSFYETAGGLHAPLPKFDGWDGILFNLDNAEPPSVG